MRAVLRTVDRVPGRSCVTPGRAPAGLGTVRPMHGAAPDRPESSVTAMSPVASGARATACVDPRFDVIGRQRRCNRRPAEAQAAAAGASIAPEFTDIVDWTRGAWLAPREAPAERRESIDRKD